MEGKAMSLDEPEHIRGFNPEFAGRRAECDGGGPVPGTQLASRMDFAGTLSGDYVDMGKPGRCWRWYLMTDLTKKPQGWAGDALWCLDGNLFLCDDP